MGTDSGIKQFVLDGDIVDSCYMNYRNYLKSKGYKENEIDSLVKKQGIGVIQIHKGE